MILAEDTRTSATLLQHYEIQTPMRSFHMHNEHFKLDSILSLLKEGQRIALISDAGTRNFRPWIPFGSSGSQRKLGSKLPPGSNSTNSCFGTKWTTFRRFFFPGFLPPKKGRQKRLENWHNFRSLLFFMNLPIS